MKPIIMSTEDVQAVLDGRKTMARIPIKPQPEFIQVHVWDSNPLVWVIEFERITEQEAKQ